MGCVWMALHCKINIGSTSVLFTRLLGLGLDAGQSRCVLSRFIGFVSFISMYLAFYQFL